MLTLISLVGWYWFGWNPWSILVCIALDELIGFKYRYLKYLGALDA